MTIPNIATFDHGTYSWFVFSIPYLELILTTAHLPKPKRESVVLSEFDGVVRIWSKQSSKNPLDI